MCFVLYIVRRRIIKHVKVTLHNNKRSKFQKSIISLRSTIPFFFQIAFVVCSENGTQSTKFESETSFILEKLKNVSKTLLTDAKNNSRENRTVMCLTSVKNTFNKHPGHGTKNIAILIVGANMSLTDETFKEGDYKNLVFVVVAVGIQDPVKLQMLNSLVSKKKHFLVIPSYDRLNYLTKEFISGTCLGNFFC